MKELVKDPEKMTAKAGSLIRNSGAYIEGPPMHVNCRCWLLPVVTEEGLERELEKIVHKSKVEQMIAELWEDPRVVMVAKPKKFWSVKKVKRDTITKKQILPMMEKYYIQEKKKEEKMIKEMMDAFITEIRNKKEGDIIINVEPTPITIENIMPVPVVNIENVAPDVAAPVVNVAAPEVKVAAPVVNIEAPGVTVENIVKTPVVNIEMPEQKPKKTKVRRDAQGKIISMETK